MSRSAAIARTTAETNIRIRLDLDGRGEHAIATGIPFLWLSGWLYSKGGGSWTCPKRRRPPRSD